MDWFLYDRGLRHEGIKAVGNLHMNTLRTPDLKTIITRVRANELSVTNQQLSSCESTSCQSITLRVAKCQPTSP